MRPFKMHRMIATAKEKIAEPRHRRRWGSARVVLVFALAAVSAFATDVFNTHQVVLDQQGKIVPWYKPADHAYDHFLRQRWNFVETKAPMSPGPEPRSSYPQYYFYCAYWDRNGVLEPDTWMNDVGEKIPNWFESGRLYYAYTGDDSVMKIVKDLLDYTIAHGTSPANFDWPNFPYTTTNAGDLEFRGFTNKNRFLLHEVQVDHAGDMGLAYYRMYLFTQEKRYLDAAIHVADALASHARTGSATQSVWPYRVVMDSGKVTEEYGANWAPSYMLLGNLVRAKLGNVEKYEDARAKVRAFIMEYPMKTGLWTDAHSDGYITGKAYKSNLSASNMVLFILDNPEFDPAWKKDVPRLIKWTEDNFVTRSAAEEPSTQWGANIVGEQDAFLYKMDYQTARYAAETARWYAISGDQSYKEKAYRALNWVTYASTVTGQCNESPVTIKKPISNWWSDCYGEGPRMFYPAFAGVPEFAPPQEDHILYSTGLIRKVSYQKDQLHYEAAGGSGEDYLRLSFLPKQVALENEGLPQSKDCSLECYSLRALGKGDYALTIWRNRSGSVSIR
jgi:hypothetical protein